jgi:glycosyltransferase involved in cell wall biosynthesis
MNILSFGLDQSALDPSSKTARRIARIGAAVDSLSVVVPSARPAEASLAGNVVVYGSGGVGKVGRFTRLYAVAKKVAVEKTIDMVTVQDAYFLASLAASIARRTGAAFEIQIHGFERYSGLRKSLARRNIGRADHIRVVSERLKRFVISEFNVPEERVSIVPVPSGIDHPECPPRPPAEGAGTFTFLSVARLVPVKGIDLMLSAFTDVVSRHPEARLEIVGDGPECRALESLAAELGVSEKVFFRGRQEDVGTFYCAADAFLMTSSSEGWGLSAVEAASYSLPIVMTDVGLAGEVLKDGESALVVPVGDKDALAAAMERVMASPADRERLGKAALLAVRRLPSLDETVRRYRAGWDKAVASHIAP